MTDDIYKRLADALDKLPNGFPRTPEGTEIRILKKIISPEEASLAVQLGGRLEPLEKIALRIGLPVEEARKKLLQLADRGLVWYRERDGKFYFRLAAFIVGIYEEQLDRMDQELAHLVEAYLIGGGAAGIMKPQPALHRVLPAQKAVKSEWVLPYDDIRPILMAAKTFNVRDCICRAQQDHLGRKCDFPLNICFNFSNRERPPQPGDISREEALALLDRAEEIGLVHTVSNVANGLYYVCNCCGCCCAILRGITDFGIENSVAYANYYAVIDPELCLGCGTCVDRCQVHAIHEQDGVSVVMRERCIGCGLCVTGCPNEVAKLQLKAEAEIVSPPADYGFWERERLKNRHMIDTD